VLRRSRQPGYHHGAIDRACRADRSNRPRERAGGAWRHHPGGRKYGRRLPMMSRDNEMNSRTNNSAGFSLIEVLVALVVISVGMIGIAALSTQGLGASRVALSRTAAVNLASRMAEDIRVNRLAQAAYNGPAGNNRCDPTTGGGVDCTPAQ